ncbi:Found in Mitochondrial Proteome [Fusarium albosuccineum]|uniref:Found in Mitochondrial Proteome n=1 Tax=Fusarium albosuccineum TaxID=1237068 RepID=A0A8H4LFL7_9HYPO|nr:Found in Mitochondrial Proteome [Fusarium albosuccineum]
MPRLSGLQKEVLALYRNCLRESRKKPQATRPHFESFARNEFSRNMSIDKRDFAAIEFLLRKGRRQLEVYASPGIKDVRFFRFYFEAYLACIKTVGNCPSCRKMATSASNFNPIGSSSPSSTRAVRSFWANSSKRPMFRPRVAIKSRQSSRVRHRRTQSHYHQGRSSSVPARQDLSPSSHSGDPCNAIHTPEYSAGRSKPIRKPHPNLVSDVSDPEFQIPVHPIYASSSTQGPTRTPHNTPEADWIAPQELFTSVSSVQETNATQSIPWKKLTEPNLTVQPYGGVVLPDTGSSQWLTGDAACDLTPTHKQLEINDQLVEAISRRIAQHLQIVPTKGAFGLQQHCPETPEPQSSDHCDNESRSPSQKEALKRFTQELSQYAEHSNAKDKMPALTPSPPDSGETLRTVSALLPFRSEFAAAGLAVTSKDQAKTPSRLIQAEKALVAETQPGQTYVEQPPPNRVVRNGGCQSSSTRISFPAAQDMNEWSKAPPTLTGPTSRVPRIYAQAYPARHNLVPLDEKGPHYQSNAVELTTEQDGQVSRIAQENKPPTSAFFSGPKRATNSCVRQKPVQPGNKGVPGLSLSRQNALPKPGDQASRSGHVQTAQDTNAGVRPVPSSNGLGQQKLAQPTPRRYRSLPAELLKPPPSEKTGNSKPQTDLPLSDVPQTPLWNSYALPIESNFPAATSMKAQVDQNQARSPPISSKGQNGSLVKPNHTTLCTRSFSSRRAARPNVPQRTSSIQNLRLTN